MGRSKSTHSKMGRMVTWAKSFDIQMEKARKDHSFEGSPGP